ncbi:MAG: FAD-dependent monooxygenase [Paracoccaceae bacterium]
MERTHDLIVAGGGLAGPLLALACARAGLDVALADPDGAPAPDAPFTGRAYALSAASQRMLSALGLWDDLSGAAQPMTEIVVTDGPGPAPWALEFDGTGVTDGPTGWMVEDRHLRAVLHDALDGSPAERLRARVTGQDADDARIRVGLSDGTHRAARLLAGCDGRGSGVARRAGIAHVGWDYDQTAVTCALTFERDHGGRAFQVFLPGGPLAILPLTHRRAAIVWSVPRARADELDDMDDAAFLSAIAGVVGPFLGAMELAGARASFPLSLSLAQEFAGPRTVLAGDAAHGVHPIAGQGLNAGLRDVAALAEVLTAAGRAGEDIGAPAVLDRYVRARRFDAVTLALATDAFYRLLGEASPVWRTLRGAAMRAIGAAPVLRRAFTAEAAGLTGPLPELMRD